MPSSAITLRALNFLQFAPYFSSSRLIVFALRYLFVVLHSDGSASLPSPASFLSAPLKYPSLRHFLVPSWSLHVRFLSRSSPFTSRPISSSWPLSALHDPPKPCPSYQHQLTRVIIILPHHAFPCFHNLSKISQPSFTPLVTCSALLSSVNKLK